MALSSATQDNEARPATGHSWCLAANEVYNQQCLGYGFQMCLAYICLPDSAYIFKGPVPISLMGEYPLGQR